MQIAGDMLIAEQPVRGSTGPVVAVDPATGRTLDPPSPAVRRPMSARACAAAWAAFDAYRETSLDDRAGFLDAIAEQILALGDALIDRACAESGLPRGRIEGEPGPAG